MCAACLSAGQSRFMHCFLVAPSIRAPITNGAPIVQRASTSKLMNILPGSAVNLLMALSMVRSWIDRGCTLVNARAVALVNNNEKSPRRSEGKVTQKSSSGWLGYILCHLLVFTYPTFLICAISSFSSRCSGNMRKR